MVHLGSQIRSTFWGKRWSKVSFTCSEFDKKKEEEGRRKEEGGRRKEEEEEHKNKRLHGHLELGVLV
jgi:hypothetical protein